ncbi:hypothetical protein NX059_002422 [Plenodomus lindquistii]|nr:hypothetical protein NX059_002422 [Plenodomus lindquistii]
MCSYSWKNSKCPRIFVPGTPPKWTPPKLPIQLPRDKGMYWVDQNGDRVAKFQFEPIFQALAVMNPTVRFEEVDVVVNRNTLQKLYSFVQYKRSYSQFFVDLDMIGNTMFIGRREKNAKIWTQSGHGRSFEKMFTTEDPDLKDVDGHHRIVRYQLGSLDLVVRMEADAYVEEQEELAEMDLDEKKGYADACFAAAEELLESGEDGTLDPSSHHNNVQEAKDLPNEFFRNLFGAFGSSSDVIPHSNQCHTQVITQGRLTTHNQSLELKCNERKPEAAQQIWFGRVPRIVYGKHKTGSVCNPEEIRWTQSDFEAWAAAPQTQGDLRKLVWLLSEIRSLVLNKTNGHAVLVAMEKGAPLQIFQAKQSWGALPRAIVERFWDEPLNRG